MVSSEPWCLFQKVQGWFTTLLDPLYCWWCKLDADVQVQTAVQQTTQHMCASAVKTATCLLYLGKRGCIYASEADHISSSGLLKLMHSVHISRRKKKPAPHLHLDIRLKCSAVRAPKKASCTISEHLVNSCELVHSGAGKSNYFMQHSRIVIAIMC